MVNAYLFTGQDNVAKDAKLKSIKEEFLAKDIEDFNLDILYARELTLVDLQEKIACLSVKAKRRIIIIRDAQGLKPDLKVFLLNYLKGPSSHILLILDINSYLGQAHQSEPHNATNEFIRQAGAYVQVIRFQTPARVDTFALNRCIEAKKIDSALSVLSQLLENGEKPERILGGLRYCWQNGASSQGRIKNRMKFLLDCDINIKTGKLKANFALEKLLIQLCCLDKTW